MYPHWKDPTKFLVYSAHLTFLRMIQIYGCCLSFNSEAILICSEPCLLSDVILLIPLKYDPDFLFVFYGFDVPLFFG